MARKKKEPEAEGCPLWVVTFGDAMSLLVTFFVMLVSFADFEEHSLQSMMGALKGGLRVVPMPLATVVAGSEADDEADEERDVVSADAASVVSESGPETLSDKPVDRIIRTNSSDYYLHLLENGVSLEIKCSAIFKPGTADMANTESEVWQVAADLMHSVDNEVRITITLPKNALIRLDGYTTSWGLGIEQALAVQAYLAGKGRVDPRQMSTAVRIVERMPFSDAAGGMISILFIGDMEVMMKGMPLKILRETWREQKPGGGEQDDG